MILFARICFEDLEFVRLPGGRGRVATADFALGYRARVMDSPRGPGAYDVTIVNETGRALRMLRGLSPKRVSDELQRVAAEARAELDLLPAFP